MKKKDYIFNWSNYLDTEDTISSVVVSVSGGIVLEESSILPDAKKVSAVVSGGVAGKESLVVCRITASNGEIHERYLFVSVSAQL